ncbi:MAG: RNA polymerase sigma factor [Candidatus Pacebacteria bacterium]|nr:RNA polymerase sigma factor [Candidatus Paceibacterota bacterium]
MKDNLKNQFESIYQDQSDAVFRFCLIRVSNREQALDLTQETFLRLWQTMSSGEKIKNNRAFIFTVARRLIIDWYRKKKSLSIDNLSFGNEEDEGEFEIMDEKTSFGNTFLEAEGRYLIDNIKKISSSYREAVYLRFVEDLSPPEIGEILGLSSNVISVRINRGLLELRKNTGYYINKENEK